ncbi:MAG TPA: hypothetical protein HA341_00195, partial [Halobacteria archaeon]|nr:hypothetical protein [Halobacteria archaeon]
ERIWDRYLFDKRLRIEKDLKVRNRLRMIFSSKIQIERCDKDNKNKGKTGTVYTWKKI